jgi:hypothetical protein
MDIKIGLSTIKNARAEEVSSRMSEVRIIPIYTEARLLYFRSTRTMAIMGTALKNAQLTEQRLLYDRLRRQRRRRLYVG